MSGLRSHQALIPAAFIATVFLIAVTQADAAVVVNGTRVVYPAAKREVTISIRNASEAPSLVQAWLDAGDPQSKPDATKVPFVLTPPLFRLDPTKVQSLRLAYTQDPMPADRERHRQGGHGGPVCEPHLRSRGFRRHTEWSRRHPILVRQRLRRQCSRHRLNVVRALIE